MSDRMELTETEFAICFPWKKISFYQCKYYKIIFLKKYIANELAYGNTVNFFSSTGISVNTKAGHSSTSQKLRCFLRVSMQFQKQVYYFVLFKMRVLRSSQ